MICIICNKKIDGKEDICQECDKLMDLFYRKHPEDKPMALQMFRDAKEDEDEGWY
jgi:hypothetical protein